MVLLPLWQLPPNVTFKKSQIKSNHEIINLFFDIFIDYAITFVPFPPHSTPSCSPPPSHIPPL